MLSDDPIFTILPASDRDRARAFYEEKLSLTPSQVQPNGDLEYETGGIRFYVTKSVGKSTGEFTQASWAVEDVDATAAELRSHGSRSRSTTCPRGRPWMGSGPSPGWAAPPTSRTARATCSG